MNRKKILGIIAVLLVIVIACDIGNFSIDFGNSGGDDQPQGGTIEAGIDAPANGANLPMAPVEVSYHATSGDGISAIELSINGEVVSSSASPDSDQKVVAMKYTWQPSVSGSHTIRVRAQSSSGLWSDFSAATVNIQGSQQQQEQEKPEETEKEEESEPEPDKPTATPEDVTIYNVEHNLEKFYYGKGSCGSREITISADVTHPDKVYAAILFIRFYDEEGEGTSKWDSGRAMVRKNDEHFSVTLFSENIPNYNMYEFTIMNYQIVLQDKAGNRLAKTDVIKKVEMDICP